MNEFGENVVTKIQGNEVEQIQVHGIVRERHERNLKHPSVLEIQLRDSQVMNELVFAHGRDEGKEDDGKNHKPEKAYEYNGNIPISMFRSSFFHVTIPALLKSPFSSLEPGWRFLEKENMAFSTCTLLYQSHRLFAPPLWRECGSQEEEA
jgi:hypothetical protein